MYCVMLAVVRAEKLMRTGGANSSAGSVRRNCCTYTDLPVPVSPTTSMGERCRAFRPIRKV